MAKLILYHEYRKLTATLFARQSAPAPVKPEDIPELREVLELRADGFADVPPPPKDFRVFWEMSEAERLGAGLMVWVEGTGWQMWFMPFEWRHEVESRPGNETLFFVSGVPYTAKQWDPDAVAPMFGMLCLGPLTGNFLQYMVESTVLWSAVACAGDRERFPDVRNALTKMGSSRECIARLDTLHSYLLDLQFEQESSPCGR